uniref:Uncharacterized protein n=1 Tax=Micromonas pusilla TaxID=38833 RepID=A0A7R9TQK3_MICPS|mmetsp:Transcript_5025/g.17932  ORF Transcript_5025/g.17932 Transcript_5025/m.17932 type:complete len:197 (+) Transcript_5025:2-592(+)
MKAAATTTATTRGVAAPLSYRRGSHAGDDNTYADVATSSRRGSPRARRLSTPSIAMAPFRNPFEEMKKANEIKRAKKEKGVKDGLETLVDKVKRGRETARERGFQAVLADVRDGVVARNYGNGGSWPEAAEARREMVCPRCGASTRDAVEAGEREAADDAAAAADPVELAKVGKHPLGWCASCAEGNRLLDTSGGF